jgi:hypothetical protein
MPVQIGAKAHSFSDPTGLLSDCHRRIEMFLKSLQHVAEVIHRPLTEEARLSWRFLRRWLYSGRSRRAFHTSKCTVGLMGT